jgi:hypothetical protein
LNERGIELAIATRGATVLLDQLGVEHPQLPVLTQRARSLADRAERLQVLPEVDPARRRGEEGLRGESLTLAGDIAKLDDSIAFAWLRERFASDPPREELLGYTTTIAAVAQSGERIDRVDFLAARLLSREHDGGQRDVLDEAEVSTLLARVVPETAIEPERRDKALGFFEQCADRLEGMESVDQLFDSGLYVDVKGFKAALAADRLDPAVLYASVLLSVAITNHLARHGARAAGGETGDTSHAFDRAPDEAAALEKRFQQARLSIARQTLRELRRNSWRTVALAAATVVCGVLALWSNAPSQRLRLQSAESAIVADVSELLLEGGFSSGEGQRVFVGSVDQARWDALDDAARGAALEGVATRLLEGMNVREALLLAQGEVVGQVVQGRVVFVSARRMETSDEEPAKDPER